jgi:hypothetical protein
VLDGETNARKVGKPVDAEEELGEQGERWPRRSGPGGRRRGRRGSNEASTTAAAMLPKATSSPQPHAEPRGSVALTPQGTFGPSCPTVCATANTR